MQSHLLLSGFWHRVGNAHVRLPPHQSAEDAAALARTGTQDAPGFWAMICVQSDGCVTVFGDRIGSIPVFYFVSGTILVIGDDAESVARKAGVGDAIDDDAVLEYLQAGYVQGPGTLFLDVHRREAGETLRFVPGPAGWVLSREFVPTIERLTHGGTDLAEYFGGLDAALQASAERLARTRRGQDLWVPLSAGLDSRIVTYYLRDACPTAVRAFSYGPADSRDVAGARSAAHALGIPWHRIASDEAVTISRDSRALIDKVIDENNLTTAMPYLQDWPHLIPEFSGADQIRGGIVCPGHSGDVPTGEMNYLPLRLAKSTRQAAGRISAHHMSLWPQTLTGDIQRRLCGRTLTTLHRYGITDSTAHSAGDLWNANNRQSKWLVNSVRGFEVFGCSWWMPLWDIDFVAFWKSVPLQLIERRLLYREFARWRLDESSVQRPSTKGRTFANVRRDAREIAIMLRLSAWPPLRAATIAQRRARHIWTGSVQRLDSSGVVRAIMGGIPPKPWEFQSANSLVTLFALDRLRRNGTLNDGHFGPGDKVLLRLNHIAHELSWGS